LAVLPSGNGRITLREDPAILGDIRAGFYTFRDRMIPQRCQIPPGIVTGHI
jgi:hypothetical protein